MVQEALDLYLLGQLLLHLVFCNHLLLYHFQGNHNLRSLILSLKDIAELPPTEKLSNLESITDRLVPTSKNAG
jgi:hypothetical protein